MTAFAKTVEIPAPDVEAVALEAVRPAGAPVGHSEKHRVYLGDHLLRMSLSAATDVDVHLFMCEQSPMIMKARF